MQDLEYGPVEFVLATYDAAASPAGIIDAVLELADAGTVRLLDLVDVARGEDGTLRFVEIDESSISFGELDLAEQGLVTEEDLNDLGDRLPPGSAALLLAVELTWAKHLASQFVAAGGEVIDSIRIPAAIVNEALAAGGELDGVEA
ncbi:hypothetical protein DY023_13020 [Microbacterium bovistercoris]|uniref:DUF1269 domain-containing protein n=1 Tax=Microbacterium bovistercoris TaxID=2293570 RepID=A0A371NRN3_9MICO|nr:DUF6325 family protein [Microbacterium bovistercoris]REJ04828.1 hypothetical protein DY023_13020 [Microbacterium bovistercoris]